MQLFNCVICLTLFAISLMITIKQRISCLHLCINDLFKECVSYSKKEKIVGMTCLL